MVAEFRAAGEHNFPHGANGHGVQATEDFDAYLADIRSHARGKHLPPGSVPCTVYWLTRGDRVLGTGSVRHHLNDFLLHEAGHIGYCIRPGERRRGCGTAFCALLVARARALGIERILITCDADNVASTRVIQHNGGVLEDERPSLHRNKIKRRYWIEPPHRRQSTPDNPVNAP